MPWALPNPPLQRTALRAAAERQYRWADMDATLENASFDRATVFVSGYAMGFLQAEVRDLRFRVVKMTGGGEYDAVAFVERRKRKEQLVPLNGVLILEGWGHPTLETSTPDTSGTVYHMKFPVFDPGWDGLLNDYLASNSLLASVIVDGRARSDLAPRSGPSDPPIRAGAVPPHERAAVVAPAVQHPAVHIEGAVETVLLDRFERDPRARAVCLQQHGYRCYGCQVLMSDVYGDIGDAYIHVHHRVPLSEIREDYVVDPRRDLVPVCPNCQAMIHRSVPAMPVEELAAIVQRRRGDAVQLGVAADDQPS